MNNEKNLYDLFINLFSSTEDLRSFVRFNLTEIYTSIYGGNASISELAYSVVDLVKRRGYIDKDLFESLIEKFPQNQKEIDVVREQFRV